MGRVVGRIDAHLSQCTSPLSFLIFKHVQTTFPYVLCSKNDTFNLLKEIFTLRYFDAFYLNLDRRQLSLTFQADPILYLMSVPS